MGVSRHQPFCLGSDCLRSHVNMTETVNPISMITMAGVPFNKIVVRVTNYGRSFRMTDPESGSDILIHDDYEWFAYMDDVTELGRKNAYPPSSRRSTTSPAPSCSSPPVFRPKKCDKYGKLIPAPVLRAGFQIPKPKDSIEKSFGNLHELVGFVLLAAAEVDAGLSLEPTADAAMKSIYEMSEEAQQKERENIILLALTAILFTIPGLAIRGAFKGFF
ncbi:chitinase [Colletotrichum tabaci]|uniref:Chitinase n=1 Tax=Colletotrichum tabaci TaxID=1209068 RepID=A0AAV9SV29_9PEZI